MQTGIVNMVVKNWAADDKGRRGTYVPLHGAFNTR